jgi:riboflavin synthase
MFTGLVASVGSVLGVERSELGAVVEVRSRLGGELAEGDSVAVNGVCLTAVAVSEGSFRAEVMNETLERSSLGALEAGSPVNLELPLRAADRLGGHFVQGHVDGVGSVAEIAEDGFSRRVRIRASESVLRYVVEKGSITVDGVSLTVAALDADSFTVALIPETLDRTTLGSVTPGANVNLEVDVLAKYVEKLVGESAKADSVGSSPAANIPGVRRP